MVPNKTGTKNKNRLRLQGSYLVLRDFDETIDKHKSWSSENVEIFKKDKFNIYYFAVLL